MKFYLLLCILLLETIYIYSQEGWIEENKKGVVRVLSLDKDNRIIDNGSGIVIGIDEDRTAYIITNKHVIENSVHIKIRTYNGKEISILKQPKMAKELDIALLTTKDKVPSDIIAFCLMEESHILNNQVVTYGFHGGDQPYPIKGIINNIVNEYIRFKLENNQEIPEGFSGGAFFDAYGNVIGINRGYYHGSNIAIKSSLVIDLLKESEIPPCVDPTPDSLVGIWISKIKGDPNNEKQLAQIQMLNSHMSKDKILDNKVEVRKYDKIIKIKSDKKESNKDALETGKSLNATILCWGFMGKESIEGREIDTYHPNITLVNDKINSNIDYELKGMAYSPTTISLSVSENSEKAKQSFINFITGFSYYKIDKLENAIKEFDKILLLYENPDEENREFIGDVHMVTGTTHWYLSQLQDKKYHLKKALFHYKKAKGYYQEINDSINLAHINNNLGLVFLGENNNKNAINHFIDAQNTYMKNPELKYEQIAVLNNLTIAHKRLKDYMKAIENGKLGLKKFNANYKFSIPVSYQRFLNDNKYICDSLLSVFVNRKLLITKDAKITTVKEKKNWIIKDLYYKKSYYVESINDSIVIIPEPILYGQLNNNIGISYYLLSKKENTKINLNKALSYYNIALSVRQKEIDPLGYARVKFNKGLLYMELAHNNGNEYYIKALTEFNNSYEVYINMNKTKANKVKRYIKKVENKIH